MSQGLGDACQSANQWDQEEREFHGKGKEQLLTKREPMSHRVAPTVCIVCVQQIE